MGKHDGKVALITGGSEGIGFAAAKKLAEEGAFVYIMGRRQVQLDLAVQAIGNNVTAIQGDVTDLKSLDNVFEIIKAEKGSLDILFANAGFGTYFPIGEITEEDYDKTFDLNVKGMLFSVQKALPIFREGGSIIMNGSTSSIKGSPAFSLYSATKAAVRSFARSWAVDLKERHIRVNVVSPGPINTEAHGRNVENKEKLEELKDYFSTIIPLGRMGEPDEVASAVSFLASEDSSFINGIELFVDGGQAQI